MKAATWIQAQMIAKAGARKMGPGNYSLLPSKFKALYGKQFTIVNNASEARYITSIEEGKTFCTCPFFKENREFGTCKHIEYAKADMAWEEALIAECEMSLA
jgi:predicted nucleic acid-binding Zn finger protein